MHSLVEKPFRVSIFALVWALGSAVQASPTTNSYSLDLPAKANLATPVWMGHPETPAGNFASLNLPLTVPESGDSLLVTIFFQEKEGGFLRITWIGTAGEQVLSSNFYEGVGMNNQRTLLIPADVVAGSGTLCLQCGDTVLDVQRMHLEWLENRTALVSSEQPDQEVVSRLGKASGASSLDGQPPAADSASLEGSLVTVPIAVAPQRIEQGVEFNLQIDGVPKAARISFAESGLAWGQHLVLWINQQRGGIITPSVPDLRDAGFLSDPTQPYVGWRDGSIYMPVTLLKTGLNSVQLSAENDDPAAAADSSTDDLSSNQPLAVNHLVCQFNYGQIPDATATPAASSTPDVTSAPAPAATATPASDSSIPSDDLLIAPIQPKP
jgi:hypothetical protein